VDTKAQPPRFGPGLSATSPGLATAWHNVVPAAVNGLRGHGLAAGWGALCQQPPPASEDPGRVRYRAIRPGVGSTLTTQMGIAPASNLHDP